MLEQTVEVGKPCFHSGEGMDWEDRDRGGVSHLSTWVQKAQWKRQRKKVGRPHTLEGGIFFLTFWLRQERKGQVQISLGLPLAQVAWLAAWRTQKTGKQAGHLRCWLYEHATYLMQSHRASGRRFMLCSHCVQVLNHLAPRDSTFSFLHWVLQMTYLVLDTCTGDRGSVDVGGCWTGRIFLLGKSGGWFI